MGTTTTNLGLYKPAVGETGWGSLVDANFDTLDVVAGDVFNVKHYGAVGNGSTNDTAAIQAALDAAASVQGVTYIPASPTTYKFSNLKLPAYAKILGAGLGHAKLERITGSTGSGIREKTAGEGNASGATNMQLSGFTLIGNGCTGDGINLGFQGGETFTSGAFLRDIYVDSCVGTAINVAANAAFFSHIWGMTSTDGVTFDGPGANFAFGIFAEDNTQYQVKIDEPYSRFFGIQMESDLAHANPFIYCNGGGVLISGVYIAHDGATPKTKLIQIVPASQITVRDVQITGAGTYTHGVYADAGFGGSGVDETITEFAVITSGAGSRWFANASTGSVTELPWT